MRNYCQLFVWSRSIKLIFKDFFINYAIFLFLGIVKISDKVPIFSQNLLIYDQSVGSAETKYIKLKTKN